MASEFKLPRLGEGAGTGIVVKVLIEEGASISPDDAVLEIETDKAIAEVPADVAGVVQEVKVAVGDEVSAGDVIFTFMPTEDAEAPSDDSAEPAEANPPDEADSVVEEVQSQVGQDPAPTEVRAAAQEEPVKARPPVPAAPSTRRFAREIGIDIAQVSGSGPAGRVSIDDVKAFAKARNEGRGTGVLPLGTLPKLPDFSQWGTIEREPLTGVRRATAEHLTAAWVAPHVTHFDKADVTEIEKFRKRFAPLAEAAGGKLTPTAIILKVVAAALGLFPKFNSSIDVDAGELIIKKYCHVGVAVDTERGLLVPVIRDVDQKSIVELSVELTHIAEKTRQGKLTLPEMQGGCFTISNLGGIGGTGFTPIVNAPEVAILGVARSRTEPVYEDDRFVPRTMMPLALSYDHRVIDGADAARFLRWIVEALENPLLLSLET